MQDCSIPIANTVLHWAIEIYSPTPRRVKRHQCDSPSFHCYYPEKRNTHTCMYHPVMNDHRPNHVISNLRGRHISVNMHVRPDCLISISFPWNKILIRKYQQITLIWGYSLLDMRHYEVLNTRSSHQNRIHMMEIDSLIEMRWLVSWCKYNHPISIGWIEWWQSWTYKVNVQPLWCFKD